jgi:hypothetical protein
MGVSHPLLSRTDRKPSKEPMGQSVLEKSRFQPEPASLSLKQKTPPFFEDSLDGGDYEQGLRLDDEQESPALQQEPLE